ncbi:unnamed protein product [Musa acuminata subsp. malaccensis]|uniref:(wild Malaysian banana) hypothetical protein n=1 Tax=Musa acuminata subsp. malaccensis TaxID=214687 RepID=A0A8D7F6F5_MUSAM|nr:unnamed protein product [Musa acuminata subsp. malaccensis]
MVKYTNIHQWPDFRSSLYSISCVTLNQVHPIVSVPGSYRQTQVTPELLSTASKLEQGSKFTHGLE